VVACVWVGKVGVPVAHLGHMAELMDGIPAADIGAGMYAMSGILADSSYRLLPA